MDTEIAIPNEWSPRKHQLEFFKEMDSGKKRACLLWHRRAGKDSSVLNFTAKEMFKRVGNYWHLFPKQRQARKAIWNGIDGQGRKILKQVFPEEIRKRTDGTEMMIELCNDSTWQLCGSDNYDSLVGSNPVGVVFSEWSLCDPNAWAYISPMLAENGGWAVFIYTARGKNHGYTLFNQTKKLDNWFCQTLTIEDTCREDGTPIITQETLQEERDEGKSEELIQQEYYCSFDAQIPGAIYASQIIAARDSKRIGRMPIEPSLEIHTAWDLGISDAMSIWFFQALGKEIRLIHYYEEHNKGMEHYIQYIRQYAAKNDCALGKHLAPHDIEVRELTSGKSRKEVARTMGISFITTQRPRIKSEGHQAVRKLFPRLWIDDVSAEHGLNCLSSYQYEWDEKKKVFLDKPLHDWASHGADALQTLALGWRENLSHSTNQMQPTKMKMAINVF